MSASQKLWTFDRRTTLTSEGPWPKHSEDDAAARFSNLARRAGKAERMGRWRLIQAGCGKSPTAAAMLAAMSNVATLANTAVAPAFNGLFYATVAGVIPVLYLAIAVQGSAYQDIVRISQVLYRAAKKKTAPLAFLAALLAGVAVAILIAGGWGEGLAIYALYQEHDQASTRHKVLLFVFLLIIAVAAPPLIALIRAAPRPAARRGSAAALDNTTPGDIEREATPEPEPGETDSA